MARLFHAIVSAALFINISTGTKLRVLTTCGAGSYLSGGTSCLSCSAGRYSAVGATGCSSCLTGTFAAAVGMASCASCGVGFYQPGTGTASCITCAGGKYSAAVGAIAAAACLKCPVGRSTPSTPSRPFHVSFQPPLLFFLSQSRRSLQLHRLTLKHSIQLRRIRIERMLFLRRGDLPG